jgi:hypothetical protein
MAITAGRMTVTTTATQVDGNSTGWTHMHLKNMDNTNNLYVGPSGVTAANGFSISKLEFFEFDIPPGDSIYLISASGTIEVAWLRING